MSEKLTLEARVSALEAALDTSEQWNVCSCGHHGSAHDIRNRCLVCACSHFSTPRAAREPWRVPTAEDVAALRRVIEAVRSGNRPLRADVDRLAALVGDES